LHYRSGKARNARIEDSSGSDLVRLPIVRRLPGFFRADARLAYGWGTSWGRMRLALEWFNLTMSREATDLECELPTTSGSVECHVQYAPAIFFPNLGLHAQF
jgi:hypothetical protein